MSRLVIHSEMDPASLAVNKKHLSNAYLPPEVKKAQDDLILEMKSVLIEYEGRTYSAWLDGTMGRVYRVEMEFGFKSDNCDIDGPIKRVLDALQKALVARGYHWNDKMVYDLNISKYISPKRPNLTVYVEEMK